ncbi:hypothetical protein BDA96_10G088600 [Sorghum bicolor]|uniref:Uncharacterized protein n=1 Tax=Sorghum bicolor TaxID=4558 RepID=A0A921Q0U6_SORBI|nr:hypothetical protein BDA96_10G088600 [Sorghum bicolor]
MWPCPVFFNPTKYEQLRSCTYHDAAAAPPLTLSPCRPCDSPARDHDTHASLSLPLAPARANKTARRRPPPPRRGTGPTRPHKRPAPPPHPSPSRSRPSSRAPAPGRRRCPPLAYVGRKRKLPATTAPLAVFFNHRSPEAATAACRCARHASAHELVPAGFPTSRAPRPFLYSTPAAAAAAAQRQRQPRPHHPVPRPAALVASPIFLNPACLPPPPSLPPLPVASQCQLAQLPPSHARSLDRPPPRLGRRRVETAGSNAQAWLARGGGSFRERRG